VARATAEWRRWRWWHPGWHLHRHGYWRGGLGPADGHGDIDSAVMPEPIPHNPLPFKEWIADVHKVKPPEKESRPKARRNKPKRKRIKNDSAI
jgi:hypothetical protein